MNKKLNLWQPSTRLFVTGTLTPTVKASRTISMGSELHTVYAWYNSAQNENISVMCVGLNLEKPSLYYVNIAIPTFPMNLIVLPPVPINTLEFWPYSAWLVAKISFIDFLSRSLYDNCGIDILNNNKTGKELLKYKDLVKTDIFTAKNKYFDNLAIKNSCIQYIIKMEKIFSIYRKKYTEKFK